MAWGLPTATRNALVAQITALADAGSGPGTIEIRSGAKPASPNDAASGTLLATVTLVDPSFGAPSLGVTTLADPGPVVGVAAGTAGWCRIKDSTGATVLDGTVGTSAADLNLATTTVSVGLTIDMTGGTITMPVGG